MQECLFSRVACVVSAEGEGCPAGSWDARLTQGTAADRTGIAVSFAKYLTEPREQWVSWVTATMDCRLTFRFTSSEPLTYYVRWDRFAGSASLSNQGSGRLLVASPRSTDSLQYFPKATLIGPFRGTYAAQDPPGPHGHGPMECGTEVVFTLETRLEITASSFDTISLEGLSARDLSVYGCSP